MLPTYILARDHLQRAATILAGSDHHSRQIRYIIERTISLLDDVRPEPAPPAGNVLDFTTFRARQGRV